MLWSSASLLLAYKSQSKYLELEWSTLVLRHIANSSCCRSQEIRLWMLRQDVPWERAQSEESDSLSEEIYYLFIPI